MYIRSKLSSELPHNKDIPGSYEWWYFDAMSADKKWAIVIIFYEGNPFSPAYIKAQLENNKTKRLEGDTVNTAANASSFPAISVSIYNTQKAEYYSFLEYAPDRLNSQNEPFSISLGSNIFERRVLDEKIEYEIILNQMLDSRYQLRGRIKFVHEPDNMQKSTDFNSLLKKPEPTHYQHAWNLIQPRAGVIGNLVLDGRTDMYNIALNGLGYHDHNVGFEPLKDSFKDWYWGRVHFIDYTLVYYLMNTKDGVEKKAWLFPVEAESPKLNIREIELSDMAANRHGLQAFRRITMKGPGVTCEVLTDQIIDDGPFYQRYFSEVTLKTGQTKRTQRGMSEYIIPERIYDRKYWWMINMRLRYLSKKAHWVQKSRLLYPRTW